MKIDPMIVDKLRQSVEFLDRAYREKVMDDYATEDEVEHARVLADLASSVHGLVIHLDTMCVRHKKEP